MCAETVTGWWTVQARESLEQALRSAKSEFPTIREQDQGDLRSSRADVLGELAGIVELLPGTVEAALGGGDDTVTRLAAQLRQALQSHGNLQHRVR